ncbi:MAG: hypothetical protein JW927_01365 [Deltaproteobacteria bacterium]|nr:hypothetical protein [Deltaproteobacteria bacterium]
MSIEIEESFLKKACKEMIETIFLCLPNAYKGTIYRVGDLPELRVEGITSGVIDDYRERIEWGLAGASDYNPPGKPWSLYRDEPDRPLEAMGWCVERQKSWTSEDPENDSRSVRLQLESGVNEFQHMEPVLVRKADLNLDMYSSVIYPKNHSGHVIWSDSDYVVVAVVKIYFRPYTIRMNSHETRVIKRLSRSLGTELLSYQLRQDSMKAMQDISRDRLNACNIIADSLRNAITKSGMIFTLAKKEIAYLREQWELMILEACGMENPRKKAIEKLDRFLSEFSIKYEDETRELHLAHERLMELSLPPAQYEKWLRMQVEEKWDELLGISGADDDLRGRVKNAIDDVKNTLGFGCSPEFTNSLRNMAEGLKEKWVSLIYKEIEGMKDPAIDQLVSILENPEVNIPGQEKSRKALLQLKALAETMGQLERNTNFLINQVLMANTGKESRGSQYVNREKKGHKSVSVTESFIPV